MWHIKTDIEYAAKSFRNDSNGYIMSEGHIGGGCTLLESIYYIIKVALCLIIVIMLLSVPITLLIMFFSSL